MASKKVEEKNSVMEEKIGTKEVKKEVKKSKAEIIRNVKRED